METTKWALDPMHSEINFKVKHMMIANVSGSFNKFNVEATTEGHDFAKGKINLPPKPLQLIQTMSNATDIYVLLIFLMQKNFLM